MRAIRMTIDDIKQEAADNSGFTHGKYVRLKSGEYRFGNLYANHNDIAGGAEAETAAFFRLRPESVEITGSSSTLKTSWDEKDVEFFTKTFGLRRFEE